MNTNTAVMVVLVLGSPPLAVAQAAPRTPTQDKTISALRAQDPETPAVQAQGFHERFLGLEFIAAGVTYQRNEPLTTADDSKKDEFGKFGWDIGATVSYGVRWVGITGSVGRHTIEHVPTYQFVVGPRFTTPWSGPLRVFAHALVGYARTRGLTSSQGSVEWVTGAGFDWAFFRVQADGVSLNLNDLKMNSFRMFVGAFIPLCSRACRDTDIIDVSRPKHPELIAPPKTTTGQN